MSKWLTVNPFKNPEEFFILRKERKQYIINQLSSHKAFEAETQNNQTFIFHPSSKKPNYFQLTYFYKGEPCSDIQRKTLEEIAEELIHSDFKILEVIH